MIWKNEKYLTFAKSENSVEYTIFFLVNFTHFAQLAIQSFTLLHSSLYYTKILNQMVYTCYWNFI